MITLGYLEEDMGHRFTFNRVFKKDFAIKFLDNPSLIQTTDNLIDQIEELHLDALAVDYKLADGGWLPYNGDEVVKAIYKKKRYFPVFMLTSYPSDAMSKLENVFLVNDKSIMSDNENSLGGEESLTTLKEKIKKAVENYKSIVTSKENRARELETKQESEDGLSDDEEKELLELHLDLQAIDAKANPLSPAKMETNSIKELRDLVNISRDLLEQLKK